MTGAWAGPLRLAVSLVVLAVLASLLDVGSVGARLAELGPGWVALGLGVSIPQALVLAWRWRFTARRLGIELPLRTALAEYYLGNFLNQVLPGGVTGDVSRAWRHARTEARAGSAVRAVVLERLSGQLVMTAVALVSVASLDALPLAVRVGVGALLLGVGALLVGLRLRRAPAAGSTLDAARHATGSIQATDDPDVGDDASILARFRADARRAVLADGALAVHLGTGVFTVGTYIAVYLIAARSLQVDTALLVLAPLVAPVLMTMLLPVTVAGWGVREAAAAALWGSVGLRPEDGVAISVAYGLLVLLSTLPGALLLSTAVGRAPGRRGRPPPA